MIVKTNAFGKILWTYFFFIESLTIMACLLLKLNYSLYLFVFSILIISFSFSTIIGFGPSLLEVYFLKLSIVLGKITSNILIIQLANLNILSCERKFTVSCLICGYYLSMYSVADCFLNNKLISENLKETPFEIDWAVSPE